MTRNGVTFPDPPPVTKRSLPAPSTAIDRSRPARRGSVPRRLTSSVVACSASRRAVRAWARRGIWASSSRKACRSKTPKAKNVRSIRRTAPSAWARVSSPASMAACTFATVSVEPGHGSKARPARRDGATLWTAP